MSGAMDNSSSAPDFEEFVEGCGSRLPRTARLLAGDAHLAEDLLQTALAKAWPKSTIPPTLNRAVRPARRRPSTISV